MARARNAETDRYGALLAFAAVTPGLVLVRVQSGRVQTRHGSWLQLAEEGTADLIGSWRPDPLRPGVALAVEAKVAKGEQSEAQMRWAEKWKRAGGLYLVARTVDELQAALRSEAA